MAGDWQPLFVVFLVVLHPGGKTTLNNTVGMWQAGPGTGDPFRVTCPEPWLGTIWLGTLRFGTL